MQCAQNLRNPAGARRAGAMRWMFHTAKLGEILFSSVHVSDEHQNKYKYCTYEWRKNSCIAPRRGVYSCTCMVGCMDKFKDSYAVW
jgi:hypothetical protein